MPDKRKAARRKAQKTLVVGPYTEDFGWELGFVNPIARRLAGRAKRVIVICPPTNRYLYEFGTEFIDVQQNTEEGSIQSQHLRDTWFDYVVKSEWKRFPAHCDWYKYAVEKEVRLHGKPFDSLTQKQRADNFIDYRRWRDLRPPVCEKVADVMLSFCRLKSNEPHDYPRQYPHDQARELIDRLHDYGYSVACYGGPSNFHYEGTVNLVGAPLEKQCSALGASRVAAGPSSATMHLASLCRTRHITWCNQAQPRWGTSRDRAMLQHRYKDYFNPFRVECRFIQNEGATCPAKVAECVKRYVAEREEGTWEMPEEIKKRSPEGQLGYKGKIL